MASNTREIHEQHDGPPSALVFMARAFLPSRGLPRDGVFPGIVQRWTDVRIDPDHHAGFCGATGLRIDDGVSVLYPHVLGFRTHMALLTHPAYPLPIWNALQIRNRLIRYRRIGLDETLDLETRISAHRVLEKGIEVDLESRLARGADCCWKSLITYFYRGRFGAGGKESPQATSPDLSGASEIERFLMPPGGGWRFGSLTGDYNGIHWWPWYARRFGFRSAFPHPQRVAGMCMARLRGPQSDAQMLELWIKGPVFYGANVVLNAGTNDQGDVFGLSIESDLRSALLGRWQRISA